MFFLMCGIIIGVPVVVGMFLLALMVLIQACELIVMTWVVSVPLIVLLICAAIYDWVVG